MSRVSKLVCIYNRAVKGPFAFCCLVELQKFIDKWRYEILAGALPGICNRGLIQRLETTSNDLIPDFDRFSRRLSRFYSPNLGDLQKKRLQFFFWRTTKF